MMIIKAKIDSDGRLALERGKRLKIQFCPFSRDSERREHCGDWCPHFRNLPNEIWLTCGTGMSWFVELTDERRTYD